MHHRSGGKEMPMEAAALESRAPEGDVRRAAGTTPTPCGPWYGGASVVSVSASARVSVCGKLVVAWYWCQLVSVSISLAISYLCPPVYPCLQLYLYLYLDMYLYLCLFLQLAGGSSEQWQPESQSICICGASLLCCYCRCCCYRLCRYSSIASIASIASVPFPSPSGQLSYKTII